jgi:hypothetical protein
VKLRAIFASIQAEQAQTPQALERSVPIFGGMPRERATATIPVQPTTAGFARMVERAGIEAKLGFKPHPHICQSGPRPSGIAPQPALVLRSHDGREAIAENRKIIRAPS